MNSHDWHELIYAAAEDPSRWNLFLQAFVEKMDAGQAVLSVRHEDHPPASIAAYVGVLLRILSNIKRSGPTSTPGRGTSQCSTLRVAPFD